MRKLDRASVPAPPSINGPSAAVTAEKQSAAAYYATRVPWQGHHTAYDFKNYKGEDVKAALWQLGGGNCAYCESKIYGVGARQVEHYRPKGGIEGVHGHPGYWWLAHEWENLLPTCRDCNQSIRQHTVTADMNLVEVEALISKPAKTSIGKANQFDVQGTRAVSESCCLANEDALLIDPCLRDPADELSWNFTTELTLISPKTKATGGSFYGDYTIRACALNRAQLVLDRIPALRPMKTIKAHIVDRLNKWNGMDVDLDDILAQVNCLTAFGFPDQPYAGMAAAFIEEFEIELNEWLIGRGLPSFY